MPPDLPTLAAQIVEKIQAHLPAHLRSAAAPVAVIYRDRPDAATLAEGFEPDLLGLYEGPSRLEADPSSSDPPPRILLFLENLWDQADHNRKNFAQEVRTTYLHELGHFLGFDEDDLTARNLD